MVDAPTVRPNDPLFNDAWAKFDWAFEHAKRLDAEIAGFHKFQSESPGTIIPAGQFHPESNWISVRVARLGPLPRRFPLILGDILHNYRSALDAAVWAAVLRGSARNLQEHQVRLVAFPDVVRMSDLRGSKYRTVRKKFTEYTLPRRAPGISRPDAAVLRAAQRFDLAEKARVTLPLALLTDKNNFDKHKALELFNRRSADFLVTVIEQRDCVVRRIEPRSIGRVLNIGTELARIHITPTGPNPDVRVQTTFPHDISIEQVPSLNAFLNSIERFVFDSLSGFGESPIRADLRI